MHEWELKNARSLQVFAAIIRAVPANFKCFHIYGSFGDVYLQCAAVAEILTQHDWAICVIIDESYAQLAKNTFGDRVRIIHANGAVINAALSQFEILSLQKEMPIRMLPTIYPMIPECILKGKLRYEDFLRVVTGSDQCGSFPEIENAEQLQSEARKILNDAGLPVGKTALICADNNTQIELPEDYWKIVVRVLKRLGWTPCLNDSGTLRLGEASKLRQLELPRIKVPPHLAVTLPMVAGTYLAGNNGFATIQALFNRKTKGFHIINGFEERDGGIRDKGGNSIPTRLFFHSEAFPAAFLRTQIEFIANNIVSEQDLGALMESHLKKIE
jgi:hypothetical protein